MRSFVIATLVCSAAAACGDGGGKGGPGGASSSAVSPPTSLADRATQRCRELWGAASSRDTSRLFDLSLRAQEHLRRQKERLPASDWPQLERDLRKEWSSRTDEALRAHDAAVLSGATSTGGAGSEVTPIALMGPGSAMRVEEVRGGPASAVDSGGRASSEATGTILVFAVVTYADPGAAPVVAGELGKSLKLRIRLDDGHLLFVGGELSERGHEMWSPTGIAATDRALGAALARAGLTSRAIEVLGGAQRAGLLDDESRRLLAKLRYDELVSSATVRESANSQGVGHLRLTPQASRPQAIDEIAELDPELRTAWALQLMTWAEENVAAATVASDGLAAATRALVDEAKRATSVGQSPSAAEVRRRARELALRALGSDLRGARLALAISRDDVVSLVRELITRSLAVGRSCHEDFAIALNEDIAPLPEQTFVWAVRSYEFESVEGGKRWGPLIPQLDALRPIWTKALGESGVRAPHEPQEQEWPMVRGVTSRLVAVDQLQGGIVRITLRVTSKSERKLSLAMPRHDSAEDIDEKGGEYLLDPQGRHILGLAAGQEGAAVPVIRGEFVVPPNASVDVWCAFFAPAAHGPFTFRHVIGYEQVGIGIVDSSGRVRPAEERSVSYRITLP